jgi:hypothetical protein
MEIWKDINGFKNYQVSNLGYVKRKECIIIDKNNREFKCKEKILKPDIVKGYHRYTLSNNNIQKRFVVHRLVAFHFIENKENKPCVNHKDGNKFNNCVDNLEWVTYSENERHSYDFLNKVSSQRKLSIDNAIDIFNNAKKGPKGNVVEFMNKYGVTRHVILNIINKKYYVQITERLSNR